MKFLFYIASLVCVSSVPISSVPERHIKQMNQSLIGLRNPWVQSLSGYMVVAQDKYCNHVHRISDSALDGTTVATHDACEEKCTLDGECRYYLWTDDGDKLTCATFKACGITTTFQDGHGGFIYKKLVYTGSNPNVGTPSYTLSDLPMKSTTLPQEGSLSLNPCGSGCTLAMPRTSVERDQIYALVMSAPKAENQAWGGTYVWLGGHWDYTKGAWYWNDGTQIADLYWDSGEPGHNTGSQGEQDFLGMKRENGKWHDFHGNGVENDLGQQGVCESVQTYTIVADGNDKYCCGSNCNDVVILDTHCIPDDGCNEAAEAPTALWGSKANCERSCNSDPNCSYYLWRSDPNADAVKTCATFKSCGTKTPFNDGDGGCIYQKD